MKNSDADNNSIQTDRIVCTSNRTTRSVTAFRRDMPDDVLQRFIPVLQRILDTNEYVTIQELGYWFYAKTEADALVSKIRMRGAGGDVLAVVTVKQPSADGKPAHLMCDLSGFINAVECGIFQDQNDINNIPTELSELTRCIAWSWLVLTGYAKLGNTE